MTPQQGLGGAPIRGRVNFGWIGESFDLFKEQTTNWIVATLVALGILVGFQMVISFVMQIFMAPALTQMQGMGQTPTPAAMSRAFSSMFSAMIPASIVAAIGATFIMAFLLSGMLRMAIRQVRGLPISVGDVLTGWPATLRIYGLLLVFNLIVQALNLPFLIGYLKALSAIIATPTPNAASMSSVLSAMGRYGAISLLMFVVYIAIACLFMPALALIADGEPVFDSLARSFHAMKKEWLPAAAFTLVMTLIFFVSMLPCYLGLFVSVPLIVLVLALVYRDMLGMPNVLPPAYATPPVTAPYDPTSWPPPPAPPAN